MFRGCQLPGRRPRSVRRRRPAGAIVTLSVLRDQSEKFASAGVLDALGRFEYPLDLFGYASGVYIVVASHAT